ncbi:MAG: Na/Pi cotransporter family protein [Oscillospiraceae bacterium]|nr:Na/Pi cotransporter family protein [Oscillospiraceae bacterium]
MGIANIIALLSGISLFLFGMTLMGEGLKKVAGNKLEIILYKLSGTPLRGILLGTAVTGVIQSSSATSVMVVGFVNSGMMTVRQAIGIIMGAIIGTSVTGWVICLSYIGGGSGWIELLSTSTLTGVIAVTGIILRMFLKQQIHKNVGDILLGFAVLMFGMQAMSGAVEPLRSNEAFVRLLTAFSNPLIGILAGAAFTAVIQSASAACGILQALSVTGALSFSAALPLLMGVAIGAAVPVLLSAIGASIAGRRTALVYLVVELFSVIVFSAVFYGIGIFVEYPFLNMVMNPFRIAALNSVFRAIAVVLLMPVMHLIERVVVTVVKDKPEVAAEDPLQVHLEERFLAHPALAVEQSRLAIGEMAELSRQNFVNACRLISTYSGEDFKRVKETESKIDQYEDGLGTYLVKVTVKELNEKQNSDVRKFLHAITDFERISDFALDLAEAAQEINSKQLAFSPEAARELRTIRAALLEIVDLAYTAFLKNDLDLAARVEPLEELIDSLCDKAKMHHIERLQKGQCTLILGFVFNDILSAFESVSDHCSNIALALIELDSDVFDKHEYLKSLRAHRTSNFERYSEEYSMKYSF